MNAPNITEAKTSIFGPFVGEKGKKGLLAYKYVGDDQSILAPSMYKIWKAFHKLVPPMTSPNVVTVTGLAIIIAATAWANFSTTTPHWVKCIVLSVALFLYQTADAVDGLQGKQVGMYQNPTTEMFDHGVDSIVTVITSTNLIQFVLGLESPTTVMIVLFAAFIGFHSPTYEHLITGKMIFRGGPANPTEALVIAQLIFLSAGLFPSFFHGYYGHVIAVMGSIAASLSLLSSIKELFNNYNGDLKKTIHSSLRGYLPLFFVMFCCMLWLPFNQRFYLEHSLLCLFTIAVPWNYAILRTIIYEITGIKNFDTMSVLIGQLSALIPAIGYWIGLPMFVACTISSIISVTIYAYTVKVSLREVCDALDMDAWYSIRDERLINKAQS
jgi:hypothetical protein